MDTKNNSVVVSETDQGRQFWLEQGLAQAHVKSISAADVLIVPLKDFREDIKFAFHQDTTSFARYLTRELIGRAIVEVLANDDEYIEIALHGNATRIGTLVVSYLLAPLVINLVSSYIYDSVKAKPTDSVEMNLVIEDHECRAMNVHFKGNAKDFTLMADKVAEIARNCEATSQAHKKHSSVHNLLPQHHVAGVHASPNLVTQAQNKVPVVPSEPM